VTKSEFNDKVDATLETIEDILDEAETDLDFQTSGGVLTVICENRTQIIFTRQAPVKQLWLALRSGGFHFDYDAEKETWLRDSDQTPLADILTTAFKEQAGEDFTFDL